MINVCICYFSSCNGGYPDKAMAYYCGNGVVNGGDPSLPTEKSGCQPYPSVMSNNDLNKVNCPTTCVTNGGAFNVIKGKAG